MNVVPKFVVDGAVISAAADAATGALFTAKEALDVQAHVTWIDDILERSLRSAENLVALKQLADASLHTPALALTRTTVEAHVLNVLVRHSRQFNETIEIDADMPVDELRRRVKAFRASMTGDAEAHVNTLPDGRHTVTIQWLDRRPGVEFDDSHQSPYYQFTQWFTGTVPDKVRPLVNPGERDGTDDDLWRQYLRWAQLLDALKRDDIATGEAMTHLRLHYAYLSRFTHPVGELRHATADETMSALCGLYRCAIAGAELASVADYIGTLPNVAGQLRSMRTAAVTAQQVASALRLFGEPPTPADLAWTKSYLDDNMQPAPDGVAWLWVDQAARLDQLAAIRPSRVG